jgi:Mannosyltransferase (PIG-V)
VKCDRRAPGWAIAALAVATRISILAAGALAVVIVGTIPPPVADGLWRVSHAELPNLLARWDTFYYYSIATGGYHWNPALFAPQSVVFFPLYPYLMRWTAVLVGGHVLLAGLLISLCAFAAALVLLYRLAALEIGDAYAPRVVVLIAVFPYALFFSAVYTESLFLLLSVGAFYAMRRARLEWVAICGILAGLTRPNGFWLALPLTLLARSPASFAAACTPLVGTAAYSEYLHFRFADALAWVHGQAAWGMPLLGRASAPDRTGVPTTRAEDITEWIAYAGNVGAFVLAAVAIRPVTRRFGLAYGAWIAVNIFPPVATHLFISLGRFTSVLFPVFFWLAVRIPRDRLWPIASAFAAAQIVLAVWFFLWLAVY